MPNFGGFVPLANTVLIKAKKENFRTIVYTVEIIEYLIGYLKLNINFLVILLSDMVICLSNMIKIQICKT